MKQDLSEVEISEEVSQEYVISTAKADRKVAINSDKAKATYDQLKENHKVYQKKVKKSTGKVVKKVKKNHHYAAQAVILLIVGVLIFVSSTNGGAAPSVSYRSGFGGAILSSTIDEVASAEVAAEIARGANLIIADNVTNLADSLSAQVEFATTYESYLDKPQIVATDAKTRNDIIQYTTKKGDTVGSLARQFNVTSDSIRWANNIVGEALGPGKKLRIPPVSGIIYTVQNGDTAGSLANKYQASKAEIIAFNDAEVGGLKTGEKIIIPGGIKPNTVPSANSYFSTGSGFAFGNTALYGGNGYSYGYCTWHVANRRQQIGRPIPRNLGNAVTWASIASNAGLNVNDTPKAGAVLWHKNTYIAGGYGHVGFVEEVRPNGSILVSDMNYPIWNGVTTRVIKPGAFANYLFIH